MIVTTTPTIEGHTIKEYKGLVSGEVIFGMNFLKKPETSLYQQRAMWSKLQFLQQSYTDVRVAP